MFNRLISAIFYRSPTMALVEQANSASAKASEGKERSVNAQLRIDRLLLVNRAMWELLSHRLQITEEELRSKITQLDLLDGKQDNRLRTGVRICIGCGKTINEGRFTCLYCTAPIEGSPFDSI